MSNSGLETPALSTRKRVAMAASKADHRLAADLHGDIPPRGQRLGKSLVDIIAENALRHEDLQKPESRRYERCGTWHWYRASR